MPACREHHMPTLLQSVMDDLSLALCLWCICRPAWSLQAASSQQMAQGRPKIVFESSKLSHRVVQLTSAATEGAPSTGPCHCSHCLQDKRPCRDHEPPVLACMHCTS